MTEKEKFDRLIENGYKYNPITGDIIGVKKTIIKNKRPDGYKRLVLKLDGKKYDLYAHRFAWYYIHKEIPNVIDHIDHNPSNNKIDNLRNVSNQKNSFNASKNSSGNKIKGYYRKRDKFVSQIKINGEVKYLGLFDNENEARQAYLNAKKIYHVI